MKMNNTDKSIKLRWVLLGPCVLVAFFLTLLLFGKLPFGPGAQSIAAFVIPFFICLTLPPGKKARAICGVVYSSVFFVLGLGGTLAYIGSGAVQLNDILNRSLGMFFEESMTVAVVGLIIALTLLSKAKEEISEEEE